MNLIEPRRPGLTSSAMLVAVGMVMAQPALAQGNKCTEEAASIRRAEAQLPRIEIAPPDDQQIVCITLETNILFARRVAAHVTHCPRSPLARNADAWQRTGSRYTAQFSDRRCKPAIRGYRG